MIIHRLLLQNFRSYPSADFTFDPGVTFIVGPNTAGKSNLLESIYLLAHGKSYRAEKDDQMVRFNENISRVKAQVITDEEETKVLEVLFAETPVTNTHFSKRYFVNGLPKRRMDFTDVFHALLFEPSDLDLISGSPSLRRDFLDEVLEQTDREYRQALLTYTKALRQRNALLQRAKESGIRQERQFAYWDEILIAAGKTVTATREHFIDYLNSEKQELFPVTVVYDKSEISVERLVQYRDAESGAGVTLVGPHRDDFILYMGSTGNTNKLELKSFGSRGQQRLVVLQLKLLQLQYLHEKLTEKPVLLLDDIFSELDEDHIRYILKIVNKQQTIITTTHREFLDEAGVKRPFIIDLTK